MKRRRPLLLLGLLLSFVPFLAIHKRQAHITETARPSGASETAHHSPGSIPQTTPGSAAVGIPADETVLVSSGDTPVSPSAPGVTPPPPVAPRDPAAPRGRSTRELAAGGESIPGILRGVDSTDPEARALAGRRIRDLQERQDRAVLAKAAALGIPVRKAGPGNKLSILHDFRGDEPLYRSTLNRNAAISAAANLVHPAPYNLTGQGVKVGVWDGGSVRNTHQELTGRVTKRNSSAANDAHATHVAGTIAASGVQANAKGMAPQAGIDSYDWNSDYNEMYLAGAAAAGNASLVPISNHSYGYDATTWDMGVYETEAAAVDAIVASLPYFLPFWAAGNEQDELTAKNGYQSITFNGLAKNLLTIGAVNDAVSSGNRAPANGSITYFSSLGPCDDGRIKPDLVANGASVYSPVSSSNSAYDTYNGTSMATPSAAGCAALIQQLHAREFSGQWMRASTIKALLIHTADDVGNTGPDYTYGWGLINVKAAADLLLEHKASLLAPKIIENTITASVTSRTHTFSWDGASPIRATLCWTDPAGVAQTGTDSRTPNLVHNLDAIITAPDGTTVVRPFVMPFVGNWSNASMSQPAIRAKNNVDNVEQVLISSPTQPGTYTVTVSLDGSLGTSSQTYSLIISGGASVESNPPPVITLDSPADGSIFLTGAPLTLTASASDLAIGGAPGAVTGVVFREGANVIGSDDTAPHSITWTPPASGNYSLTAIATDDEGLSASSAISRVSVLSGDGSPLISSFAPAEGQAGTTVVLTGDNFAGVSAVRFNGVDATFVVDSLTQITVTVPAAASTGPITVTTSQGTAQSATDFTVLQAQVLISQIYGGAGSSGSTYRQDYVELHNRGSSAISLSGWSVQYASASGNTWAAVPLGGSIPADGFYLVGLGTGSSGVDLPSPDAIGSTAIATGNGKIALRNTTAILSGSSPLTAEGLQDFVGYGSANASEGSPAPSPSATTAIFRAGGGTIDTGNNQADFSTAPPNPRNSSTGVLTAPAITSAATAGGTTGLAFSYQISATNAPTSFDASGLPAGLTVNPATGAIAGIPTVEGNTTATISATNAAGTGSASLVITIQAAGGSPVTLFSENMGTPSGTTAIASHTFQNTGHAFSGTADVRNTTPSTGYTGASGGGNVFVTGTVGRDFMIAGINTSGHTGLTLSFGHHKSTNDSSNQLVVEVSDDGTNYTQLTYTRPSGAGTSTWLKITPTGTIPSTPNLRIRFGQTSGSAQFRIDDVTLTGTPAATPGSYESWIAGHPGLTDPGLLADPENDGFANLMEYFAGLDPTLADGPVVVATGLDGGQLTMTYRRAKGITGVTGTAKWADDLAGPWSSAGITESVEDMGAHEFVTATAPPAASSTRRFMRLEVVWNIATE